MERALKMEKAFQKMSAQPQALPESKEPLALPVRLKGSAKEKRQLTHIINEMCKSDAGMSVIETALDNDYTFLFDKSIGATYGYADSGEEVCALNPNYPAADLITTIAHELRHVQQFETEIYEECDPYSANVKSNLMLTRAMEADAEAYGCLVSWELKEQGAPDAWNTFKADFPEVAKPFEKALSESGDVNEARTAAFMGWFDNLHRRDSYDAGYVETMSRIKADKTLKNYKPERFIEEICQAGGDAYFTQDYKIIGSDKCVSVSPDTKKALKEIFDRRAAEGKKPDASLNKLPVVAAPVEEKPAAKSQEAKAAAVEAKQESARAAIMQKRAQKDAASMIALRARAAKLSR